MYMLFNFNFLTHVFIFIPSDPHTVVVQVIITGGSMDPPYFNKDLYEYNTQPGLNFNNTVGTLTAEVPDPGM